MECITNQNHGMREIEFVSGQDIKYENLLNAKYILYYDIAFVYRLSFLIYTFIFM